MFELGIVERSLLQLIDKCLHAGVLDGEAFVEPAMGTTQRLVLATSWVMAAMTWSEPC
jgi:hypothetical protein